MLRSAWLVTVSCPQKLTQQLQIVARVSVHNILTLSCHAYAFPSSSSLSDMANTPAACAGFTLAPPIMPPRCTASPPRPRPRPISGFFPKPKLIPVPVTGAAGGGGGGGGGGSEGSAALWAGAPSLTDEIVDAPQPVCPCDADVPWSLGSGGCDGGGGGCGGAGGGSDCDPACSGLLPCAAALWILHA